MTWRYTFAEWQRLLSAKACCIKYTCRRAFRIKTLHEFVPDRKNTICIPATLRSVLWFSVLWLTAWYSQFAAVHPELLLSICKCNMTLALLRYSRNGYRMANQKALGVKYGEENLLDIGLQWAFSRWCHNGCGDDATFVPKGLVKVLSRVQFRPDAFYIDTTTDQQGPLLLPARLPLSNRQSETNQFWHRELSDPYILDTSVAWRKLVRVLDFHYSCQCTWPVNSREYGSMSRARLRQCLTG